MTDFVRLSETFFATVRKCYTIVKKNTYWMIYYFMLYSLKLVNQTKSLYLTNRSGKRVCREGKNVCVGTTENDSRILGLRVAYYRKMRGMTQEQFAGRSADRVFADRCEVSHLPFFPAGKPTTRQ